MLAHLKDVFCLPLQLRFSRQDVVMQSFVSGQALLNPAKSEQSDTLVTTAHHHLLGGGWQAVEVVLRGR